MRPILYFSFGSGSFCLWNTGLETCISPSTPSPQNILRVFAKRVSFFLFYRICLTWNCNSTNPSPTQPNHKSFQPINFFRSYLALLFQPVIFLSMFYANNSLNKQNAPTTYTQLTQINKRKPPVPRQFPLKLKTMQEWTFQTTIFGPKI